MAQRQTDPTLYSSSPFSLFLSFSLSDYRETDSDQLITQCRNSELSCSSEEAKFNSLAQPPSHSLPLPLDEVELSPDLCKPEVQLGLITLPFNPVWKPQHFQSLDNLCFNALTWMLRTIRYDNFLYETFFFTLKNSEQNVFVMSKKL